MYTLYFQSLVTLNVLNKIYKYLLKSPENNSLVW